MHILIDNFSAQGRFVRRGDFNVAYLFWGTIGLCNDTLLHIWRTIYQVATGFIVAFA